MKKSLLVLTAALSFGMASAQTEAPAAAPQVPTLTDVPAGHWAKDAVDLLVSRGIILGYPDGTYRGTQNLTRYEAAVIIARLLDQIRVGEVAAPTDPEVLTALQNAIQELAADLAALGVRVSDLEENAVSREDFTRLEERVEALAAAQGEAEALAAVQAQIDELTARVDGYDYDTLRADVDDNASSIAALNDLTVLLNQDILNLQDRTSALEAAQADLVARADFDTLVGRVGVVEANITNLGNRLDSSVAGLNAKIDTSVAGLDGRLKLLEKYAFTVKPSLSATYYVARSTRDMDFDRLIPGTVFSTGTDGDGDTKDTPVDYGDMSGGRLIVVNDAANIYGFSNAGNKPNGTVVKEGETTINFSISFASGDSKIASGTSAANGNYAKSTGGLNVNSVSLNFGIRAGIPGGSASYPDVTVDGTTYRPLFFYFNNGTAQFTVGSAPITVDFGKSLKWKFADYIGDNDKTARGDGFIVNVDGSTLPAIGAYKPTLQFVYGSRGGANGDYKYYRGARATITPIGTLKAGIHVLQEGIGEDAALAGATVTGPSDVTAFGADLHGAIGGWQVDSEYAQSRIFPSRLPAAPANATEVASAFYAKVSGAVGPVKITDLNYRSISANYDAVAGIMEANPKDGDNGSTAPYAANQTGFGVRLDAKLGPVDLTAYVDNKVDYGYSPFDTASAPGAVVDRGANASVNLFNLFTVGGGYFEYLSAAGNYSRYYAAAEAKFGLGLGVRAYYNNVANNGVRVNDDVLPGDDAFARSKYMYEINNTVDNSGCSNYGTCYSAFGVEAFHDGKDANALVKGLDITLGYALRYRTFTNSYSNGVLYGRAAYSGKFGIATVGLGGNFESRTFDATELAANSALSNRTTGGVELSVKTDPLNIVFKPSFEGYVKYYNRAYDFAGTASDYTASDITYRAGINLGEFLLPNTKLSVYYAGYQGTNRAYSPYVSSSNTAGAFIDQNNGGRVINQNLLYVEGNYADLSVGYGYGNLTLREANGTRVSTGTPAAVVRDGRGSVFKISYKVNF